MKILVLLIPVLAIVGCDQSTPAEKPESIAGIGANANQFAPEPTATRHTDGDLATNDFPVNDASPTNTQQIPALGAAEPAANDVGHTASAMEPAVVEALPAKPRKPFKPAPGTSWQWQISGTLNTSYDVEAYDIDLFDTPEAAILELQEQGRAVICYFSAGTYEDWRVDASNFQSSILGKPLGDWPGERWIDIRSQAVRAIMSVRLDLAALKGCDAVEPDNVDAFTHDTGFSLTPADQINYAKWLADEAHSRNMTIGLKNNLGQLKQLEPWYDFAVNEQCSLYAECLQLKPFTNAGKAVFRAEYDPTLLDDATLRSSLCSVSNQEGHSTLILPRLLNDRFRIDCLKL